MSSWCDDRLRCTSAWVTCLCKEQCLISNKILTVVVKNACVGWASVPWVLCVSTSTRVGTVYRAFCHCAPLGDPCTFYVPHCNFKRLSVWRLAVYGCVRFTLLLDFWGHFSCPVHAKMGMHSLRGAILKCQACLPVTACMLLANIPNHALNRTWTLSSAIWT